MAPRPLFSYPKYWAECYGTAPFLPLSREEMETLGWDSCDVILVTGDAYVDHPSFGMAIIGRLLEAQGFRVGMLAQPDWNDPESFMALGEPNLFFGVTAGNMDSLINRYTADRRMRSDDAYTPHGEGGKRPERAVIVYTQRCKQSYPKTPVVIGGIEASLRRIAQYDYWSDQVRASVLVDSGADILLYGNAERALCEVAHLISQGRNVADLPNLRGTVTRRKELPGGWTEIDATRVDWPADRSTVEDLITETEGGGRIVPQPLQLAAGGNAENSCIRLPSFEKVRADKVLYAHASRIVHQESNPNNARTLVQRHAAQEVWVNPPPLPLSSAELDGLFALPFQRVPHPSYGAAKIPAYEMIRFSVNIMRGCFGGCTFCSITEHEGRIIQSRSRESIIAEIEQIRDTVPGFTGAISDLGGPTANMYGLNCREQQVQRSCRRLSCIYPKVCRHLVTDHSATTTLYREARRLPGIKQIAIASGVRYDLAIEDPEYVRELVTHHVGGYLKIAPEHSEQGTLAKMMKPGIETFDKFRQMFEKYSRQAGKKQYLIPYFIAAHPGCTDEEMVELALWLKRNRFRVDQVQNFYPSPMSLATAMYYSERNPLARVGYKSEFVWSAKTPQSRRLQKALLRYHDAKNWALLREALGAMQRQELIGNGPKQLIPLAHRGGGRRRK